MAQQRHDVRRAYRPRQRKEFAVCESAEGALESGSRADVVLEPREPIPVEL